MNKRTHLAIIAALTASLPAFAEIKLTDKISTSGYVSGSISNTITDGVEDSFFDVDSVKVQINANLEKVTGVASLHSFNTDDAVFLDAYATYKPNATTSVTFGKFLSYLGYEAFDYPNMLQISYANTIGGFIPAYHSGVRVDFTEGGFSGGFALLDSVYGPTYFKGDGDLDNGGGAEAFVKFTSGNSSLFAAVAVDEGVGGSRDGRSTFDIWAQTKAGNVTLAAEYCYSNFKPIGGDRSGYFWLALAQVPINPKWSIVGRLSGGEDEALSVGPAPAPKFFKATISPSVTITDNLGLLFEYSHIKYDNFGADKANFWAAQVIFKW